MSTVLISTHLYEKRPLKRPKLGPPDVYPQDPRQKEDELTQLNVKQGFLNISTTEEFGTAKNENISSNRFSEYFSSILAKKHELNTFTDTSKKKHVVNKENALYVTAKTKNYVDGWFKDLASNSKSLAYLSKKVPFFNKKEEMFVTLYEYSVPMIKAQWFLKLSNAHQMAMSESNNKSKKRQMPDPSQEWTLSLCKFMKELYMKIVDNLNNPQTSTTTPASSSNSSVSTATTTGTSSLLNSNSSTSFNNSLNSSSSSSSSFSPIGTSLSSSSTSLNSVPQQQQQQPIKTKELLNQWNYYSKLIQTLYDEGLLDRHDFLTWLLELFEKSKSIDDPMLTIMTPLVVHFITEFTQSEFLSRHLAFHCAKKIGQLVEFSNEWQNSDSDKENTNNKPDANKLTNDSGIANLSNCFKDIISCSKYRELMFALCTIIQVITINCPTALIWHNFEGSSFPDNSPFNRSSMSNAAIHALHGSPLDYLPCEPSNLPMPPVENVEHLRNKLRNNENLIRHRSMNSEKKWFYKTFESVSATESVGNVVNRLLDVLDYLDKHLFDKITTQNSFDTLYHKIFNTQDNSVLSDVYPLIPHNDVAVVKLLCEWAVTTKRLGEYRSRIVAKLLERRQTEILAEKDKETNKSNKDEKDSNVTKMEVDDDKEQDDSNIRTNANNNDNDTSNDNTSTIFIYQQILFEFLDQYAPVTEDKTLGIFFNSQSSANGSSNQSQHSTSANNAPNTAFSSNTTTGNGAATGSGGSAAIAADNKQAFNNLVLLFAELIRYDVFSHDVYMCTLISRGHFVNTPNISLVSSTSNSSSINHSSSSGIIKNNGNEDSLTGLLPSNLDSVTNGGLTMNALHKSTSSSSLPMFDPLSTNNSTLNHNEHLGSNMFMMNDNDEDKLDEDLDKLLQNIKAGQQSKDDQNDILLPDAESDKEDDGTNGPNSVNTTNSTSLSDLTNGPNKTTTLSEQISPTARHLLYTLHFPLPQDESFVHECNQRHILLYGVGKTKDEARHIVKKVTKEIQKLFNRKTSLDISDNGKVKKHVIREGFNFESAIAKFQNLSIFDQHVVTNSCASTVLEMLNGVVMDSANHLPLIESVAFLFDLMEIALNVNGLVEFIVQMLKDLVDVENVLQKKCSMLARPYCTSIALYIVGVLNRYHNYVLASTEDVVQIFECLLTLLKPVNSPSDCSSAERCIFFYLDDLYSLCVPVLKKYTEKITPISNKIKAMISIRDEVSCGGFSTQCIMMQYLKNPREKVDSIHIRQLNENAMERYWLVSNAICCIAEANDMDYLNELSVRCAELTAVCWQLSNEWYSAFQALCNPNCTNGYLSLLREINIGDRSIYDNLAVFVSILVARRCFSLEDLIFRVFIPSLLIPTVETKDENERRARLCCHLILYLFKYYDSPLAASNSAMNSSFASSSRYSLTSPGPLGLPTAVAPTLSAGQPVVIKYACDRYLLGGALNSLRLELILTLLKAIFVLGTQEKKFNSSDKKSDFEQLYKSMAGDDDFNERSYLSQIKSKNDSGEKPSLSDFAKYVLRQVCLQDWVHDRCLRGFMIQPNAGKLLFDKKISYKDSQCLLNMICYHKQILSSLSSTNSSTSINVDKNDSKQIINIFQNLDEWSLRISWLQLNLIYENFASGSSTSISNQYPNQEMISWLDTLAPAILDYFQQSCNSEPILDSEQLTVFTSKSSTIQKNNSSTSSSSSHHNNNSIGSLNFNSGTGTNTCNTTTSNTNNNSNNNERIWLLKPLISKLPLLLQSKILRFAASLFDSSNWIVYAQNQSGSMSSKSKSVGFQGFKNTNNGLAGGISLNQHNPTSILLSYQPFVSLLLMCLANTKDDHYKESLLKSLYLQLQQLVNEKLSDDIRSKNYIQDGLQLRLSLLGALFDMIKQSTSFTNDWVVLLAQLISYTIVDPHINYVNFSTVLDMLTSLMHHSHATNSSSEPREETKRLNQNLIKKLKKELNVDRVGLGVRMARQLLPLVKPVIEVITCETMGSLVDTKGNKIAGFDSIDKKQGLQVAEKQRLIPWDLTEGIRFLGPLPLTWFNGVRMERKPLRIEENFALLSRHDHEIYKPTSFYIEAPPIPPEDEPPPPPLAPVVPVVPVPTPVQQQLVPNGPPVPPGPPGSMQMVQPNGGPMPPMGGYNNPMMNPNGPPPNMPPTMQPTGPPPPPPGPHGPPHMNQMGPSPHQPPPPPHPTGFNQGPPPPTGPPNAPPPMHPHHHQMHQTGPGPVGPGPGPGGPTGPSSGTGGGFPYHPMNHHSMGGPGSHAQGPPPPGPMNTPHHPGQQQHMMNNEPPHPMNQTPHHQSMMMGANQSMIGPPGGPPMPPMDHMMDHHMTGPHGHGPPMAPGPMPPGLRGPATMGGSGPPPMPPMPPNVSPSRAQAPPKKPKATRKRRNTKAQQAAAAAANQMGPNQPTPGGGPPGGPPSQMRMQPNSFDSYGGSGPNTVGGGGGGGNWYQQQPQPPQQQQGPPPHHPHSNSMNQSNQFYHQSGSGPGGPNQSMMAPIPPPPQQQPPTRFHQEQMMQQQQQQQNTNSSKLRLRAMLNTRHPNSQQFNNQAMNQGPQHQNDGPMNHPPPQQPPQQQTPMMQPGAGGSMFNAGPGPTGPRHQMTPHQMQMQQQQQQKMRQQVPPGGANQSMMANQNQMFQQQQQPQQHHMQQQQHVQSSNFHGGGPAGPQQQSMGSFANQSMMDNSMTGGGGGGNYQTGQPPMQQRSGPPPQPNQGQFMQQRSHMGNFGPNQPPPQQQMNMNNPNQWSQGQGPPQAPNRPGPPPMTQLQRQLSAGPNQAPPQQQQPPYPY